MTISNIPYITWNTQYFYLIQCITNYHYTTFIMGINSLPTLHHLVYTVHFGISNNIQYWYSMSSANSIASPTTTTPLSSLESTLCHYNHQLPLQQLQINYLPTLHHLVYTVHFWISVNIQYWYSMSYLSHTFTNYHHIT